jgi:RNA polymerase sigma-70 factor (ECF subfamily)
MDSLSALRTSASLLACLRDGAADAPTWETFVRRYGPHVYRWCRHWGLQEADAQDVTQAVLTKLVVKLRDFTYDPARSFRAYLKTLARYAWQDYREAAGRPGGGSGDSAALERLHTVEARDDLLGHLDAEFERAVLEEALGRVRGRVEPHTWEAFRLTALEGLSGADAGARLGLKVATVYKARSKVQKLLQEETARLEGA